MTIFLALRNYYLRITFTTVYSWYIYSKFDYRNVQSIKWCFNPWFFRTISVKWVIIWFKVKWTSKTLYSQYQLCQIWWRFCSILWSGILYQQKLGMLRLCHLLIKTFKNGSHQIGYVNFVKSFWVELVLQTLENNCLWENNLWWLFLK